MKKPCAPSVAVSRRSGFSHVELLVCLVIILTLASIVLSAIVRTRETSRASQCKDNLHNLVLALGNYEGRYGAFPIGVVEPESTRPGAPVRYGFGWAVALLPDLEQRTFYELFDWTVGLPNQPLKPEQRQSFISIYHCPSQPEVIGREWSPSSYAGAHHHLEAAIDADNTGTLIRNRSIYRAELVDGVQYTIAFGEKRITADDAGWPWGTSATLRNTGTPLVVGQGNGFSAEVINNAPRREVSLSLSPPIGGFGSDHIWGVHFAFHDGSVRLVPSSIPLELLQRLAHRSDGELIDVRELQKIEVPQ